MGTNVDTEERPSLSTDAQSKGHSSSVVWKPPKDSKEWSDEHISKEQTDRQKEVSPSQYSSIDNALREPSIAGKNSSSLQKALMVCKGYNNHCQL